MSRSLAFQYLLQLVGIEHEPPNVLEALLVNLPFSVAHCCLAVVDVLTEPEGEAIAVAPPDHAMQESPIMVPRAHVAALLMRESFMVSMC